MNGDDDVKPGTPLGSAADEPEDSGLIEMLAGIMFAGIGSLALLIGRTYPLGTALDMGPGYIPRLVALALIGLGCIGIVRGFLARDGVWPRIPFRPLILVSVAILAFAGLIGRAGLFITCVIVTLIAITAAPRIHWREAPLVALGLAAFCTLLFGYALRLPIPVWPQ